MVCEVVNSRCDTVDLRVARLVERNLRRPYSYVVLLGEVIHRWGLDGPLLHRRVKRGRRLIVKLCLLKVDLSLIHVSEPDFSFVGLAMVVIPAI